MAKRLRRSNERLLDRLRATAVGVATLAGLLGMHFEPRWAALAAAAAAGLLALASADVGIAVAVLALTLPLAAAEPLVGIAFAIVALLSVRYLAADGGRMYLLVAAAIAGAFYGPVWVVVALAGYLFTAGEAAVAAAIACVVLEVTAVLLGADAAMTPALVNGGTSALIGFANAPSSLLSPEWATTAFGALGAASVDRLLDTFASMVRVVALVAQPAIWALGAAVASMLVRRVRRSRNPLLTVAAASTGVLVASAGSVLLQQAFVPPVAWGPTSVAAISSIAIAALTVAILEKAFAVIPPAPATRSAQASRSIAAEDADVDELLRLVATAEEKLATEHTTTSVVMITDMKSFSRMAEEQGSIVTAKAIQRHRDMMLPIIEKHGGHGKSTGGDGLVAAFESADGALAAAAQMQRVLTEHNAIHTTEHELAVRIGIASGEVVLDKGGRPFIGTALNLAARVMDLADGGQALATAEVVAQSSGAVPTHSHGEFELKNIAGAVEVAEVLWSPELEPRDPRTHHLASQ